MPRTEEKVKINRKHKGMFTVYFYGLRFDEVELHKNNQTLSKNSDGVEKPASAGNGHHLQQNNIMITFIMTYIQH